MPQIAKLDNKDVSVNEKVLVFGLQLEQKEQKVVDPGDPEVNLVDPEVNLVDQGDPEVNLVDPQGNLVDLKAEAVEINVLLVT